MYLVAIKKIEVIDKIFTLYEKAKVKVLNVDKHNNSTTIHFEEEFKSYRKGDTVIIKTNDSLLLLEDIPFGWYDSKTTETLPYRARIIVDFPRSGLSKEMIKELKSNYYKNSVIGTLLPNKGYNKFVIDKTNEVITCALNHYYYEPI